MEEELGNSVCWSGQIIAIFVHWLNPSLWEWEGLRICALYELLMLPQQCWGVRFHFSGLLRWLIGFVLVEENIRVDLKLFRRKHTLTTMLHLYCKCTTNIPAHEKNAFFHQVYCISSRAPCDRNKYVNLILSPMKQVPFLGVLLELAPVYWTCLCLTEQIKPQHIISEDSLDNDDEPRKGKLRAILFTWRAFKQRSSCVAFRWLSFSLFMEMEMWISFTAAKVWHCFPEPL